MPQLRRDPLLDRWVIISEERAQRPAAPSPSEAPISPDDCPFCPGNEAETRLEIEAVRNPGTAPNSPGWSTRVVPNKFPALEPEIALDPSSAEAHDGLFEAMPGHGHHEVIIEGEAHTRSVTELPPGRLDEAFRVYRNRYQALAREPNLRSAVLIKNVGRAAGASIEHSHSQLIATPVVPPSVATEHRTAAAWYAQTGRCISCATLEAEALRKTRVVWSGEHTIALCPWAPRFAYETWILPRAHAAKFEDTNDATLAELADATSRVLRAIDDCLHRPPYNYVIHSAPFASEALRELHWRLVIMPRVTHAAGYEQSTGLYINPVSPEAAAEALRAALA